MGNFQDTQASSGEILDVLYAFFKSTLRQNGWTGREIMNL
jgi:hypothetical protein